MITYRDLVNAVIDYVGGDNSPEAERFARRAVLVAYDDVVTGHTWSYYFTRGRIVSVAQQTTGTITYTESTRTVVLAGATWPTWAAFGTIVLDQFPFAILERVDSTTLTLVENNTPGANLAAGTTYTLYRDTYAMPADFRTADEVINMNNTGPLAFLHPREWLNSQRLRRGPSTPRAYTFTGDALYPGRMVCRFTPPPDQAYLFDFLYQRSARAMAILEYKTGTVTTTGTNTTVTGSGTAWTSDMIGSVIRLSDNATNVPTSRDGQYPYTIERLIVDVVSPTEITVDSTISTALSSVKHLISDPADIEEIAMSTFLMRECEKQMRLVKRMKPTPEEMREYESAQFGAWESDARNIGRRAAGTHLPYPVRMADMPTGPDT